jgi:PIN domain nuclease of toxin-antitoxin system
VRILVDTHCWLWLTTTPERLSARTLAQIEADDTELFLSAGSACEIAVKYALGKLRLPQRPAEYLATYLGQTRTTALAVTVEHAAYVAELPAHHRDPFDRLLVAQGILERLPILTADPQIKLYDVQVMDA